MTLRKAAIATLALLAVGGQVAHARSTPCRDSHGRYTSCTAPQKNKPCRDREGKFTKCPPPVSGQPPAEGPPPSAAPPVGMTTGTIPNPPKSNPN
ncbi:hypothetical protein [Gluconobacter morbifer]|uniref:Uncharacterized protein n=1 Tax=Gluconobacter morbifer G707 TaxID=1088869 RepID=G6XKS9_9PROT|nr:hypothetical protein [Gluconobacter morbifer]EHH67642.1 hypothetical protein GMO_20950 [Gluconobacter morbifer G707]